MTKTKGKGKKRERSQVDALTLSKKRAYLSKDPYSFDPFDTWVWKQYEGSKSVSIAEFIEKYKNRLFFIGTDSQQYPKYKKCVFSSVLIAYDYDSEIGCGHGASAIRYTDKRPMIPIEALSARLTVEVQRSIEICKFVESKLFDLSDDDNDYTQNLKGICIDVSQHDFDKSCRYKDALVGMVMGYGWHAFVKPDAWASSKVADKKC